MMPDAVMAAIKSTIIEYAKSRNEYRGAILEAFNHAFEAVKILSSLPQDIQADLRQIFKPMFPQGFPI